MSDQQVITSGSEGTLKWSRYKFPGTLIRYGIYLIIAVFLGYSIDFLNIHLERFADLFERMGSLISNRYLPVEFEYIQDGGYIDSIIETVQMAYLGALFGILLSIPLAWLASFRMSPSRRIGYPIAKLIIMGCRSIHEMIWTIIFVTILGFGMLPGVLALTLFCIGFAGKLFTEEVDAIDIGQVEAIRATGGNEIQVLYYAIFPQVKVAWAGISIYTWDVAFRAATVVGYFGAGGMGWHLRRATQSLETQRVAAILISIIMLVVVSEVVSVWVRGKVAGNGRNGGN